MSEGWLGCTVRPPALGRCSGLGSPFPCWHWRSTEASTVSPMVSKHWRIGFLNSCSLFIWWLTAVNEPYAAKNANHPRGLCVPMIWSTWSLSKHTYVHLLRDIKCWHSWEFNVISAIPLAFWKTSSEVWHLVQWEGGKLALQTKSLQRHNLPHRWHQQPRELTVTPKFHLGGCESQREATEMWFPSKVPT